jgi:hypothetical protein
MEISPCGIHLAAIRFSFHQGPGAFAKAASSDGAPVGIAPCRRVRVLEQDDDGVVGFFVVCFGVLAG